MLSMLRRLEIFLKSYSRVYSAPSSFIFALEYGMVRALLNIYLIIIYFDNGGTPGS